jgi:uncharacterized protein
VLEFRPHHFLCALGYRGNGYSAEFIAGFDAVAERLRAPGGDATPIRVTAATDSICAPCPNRRGDLCATEEKIGKLDRAHAATLGIAAGEVLSWGDAKRKIAAEFTEERFDEACAPCSWRPLGICRQALRELRAGGSPE